MMRGCQPTDRRIGCGSGQQLVFVSPLHVLHGNFAYRHCTTRAEVHDSLPSQLAGAQTGTLLLSTRLWSMALVTFDVLHNAVFLAGAQPNHAATGGTAHSAGGTRLRVCWLKAAGGECCSTHHTQHRVDPCGACVRPAAAADSACELQQAQLQHSHPGGCHSCHALLSKYCHSVHAVGFPGLWCCSMPALRHGWPNVQLGT